MGRETRSEKACARAETVMLRSSQGVAWDQDGMMARCVVSYSGSGWGSGISGPFFPAVAGCCVASILAIDHVDASTTPSWVLSRAECTKAASAVTALSAVTTAEHLSHVPRTASARITPPAGLPCSTPLGTKGHAKVRGKKRPTKPWVATGAFLVRLRPRDPCKAPHPPSWARKETSVSLLYHDLSVQKTASNQ